MADDHFSFDYSIIREAFDAKIYKDFGHFDIDVRELKNYDNLALHKITVVDYYVEGEHIATWSRDRGQIFK